MQKVTPSLWFDKNAEEAMEYYVSAFNSSPNKKEESKIVTIKRYPEGVKEGPMAGMGGKVLTGIFELEGQRYMCLDGGPIFKFNESVSFMVACKDQTEIDYLWEKLSAVPESEQCGWCKDKFGLSWQIWVNYLKRIKHFKPCLKCTKLILKNLKKLVRNNLWQIRLKSQQPQAAAK
jgi:predicted 3-demethylubiquinone-9 3-methyltransferase (glyoxalase superfamily)